MGQSEKTKRLNYDENLPLSPYMAEQFKMFRKSYDSRSGHKTYTARPEAFLRFFYICDQHWQDIPSYETLEKSLSKVDFQKAMPVFKWLVKKGDAKVSDETYQIILIQCAIQETLASFGETPPLALQSYLDHLNQKFDNQEITQKSIRGFLQPPMYLYHQFKLNGAQTPSQRQIDGYLKEHTGNRSIIGTFVKFLNKTHGTALVCKLTKKAPPIVPNPKGGYGFVDDNARKLAENALVELGLIEQPFNDAQKLAWINQGIRYFHRHAVNIQNLHEVVIQNSRESSKLMVVKHFEASFLLPRFLHP